MSRGPLIVALEATCLDVPLVEPFAISLSTLHAVANVLVSIRLDDGTEGLGEAAPWTALTGETRESVFTAIEAVRPLLLGEPIGRIRPLSRGMREVLPSDTSARAGIESALFDAFATSLGIPLHRLFGGSVEELVSDLTIPIVPPARARERAREIAGDGFRMIKVKVGNDLGEDLARLRAIREGAPQAELTVDANQGYTPDAALEVLGRLAAEGIVPALYEQPVAKRDLEGLARVAGATEVPVAADEAVHSREDAIRVASAGAADVINIKLMKCGGMVEAMDIAAVARSAGIGLMIGGMVETRLGMNASFQLATGLGGFSFVDLDTHLLLAEDPFEGGFVQHGPRMTVTDAPGAGIRRRAGV